MIDLKQRRVQVGAVAIAIISIAGLLTVLRGPAVIPDFPCGNPSKNEVVIEVAKGETGSQIAETLFLNGVVKSSRAFFGVAVGDKRAATIAPGTHLIQKNLCAKEALDQMLDNKRIQGLINIFEGAWNSEIYALMEKNGFSKTDIQSALRTIELPEGYKTLEGLLFPAQYSFADGTSTLEVIRSMVSRGTFEIARSGISNGNGKYSPQQLLTIASIAQAEGNEQDFTKISRVIRNRLEIGMPLQMDSTVHYIKKLRGSIFLSTKSTFLKSSYNTYRNYGLPPGPIGNPGSNAMLAAVNPELGNWLYFITVAPFDTRFTSSADEFSKWKVEYKKNLRAGLFRSSNE